MLELIEKLLKIVVALLQRQAAKDADAISEAEVQVGELRERIQKKVAHRAKCQNVRRKVEALAEEF